MCRFSDTLITVAIRCFSSGKPALYTARGEQAGALKFAERAVIRAGPVRFGSHGGQNYKN
jgi:hypothetical protein